MIYGDFKDFPTRTSADKELLDREFSIAKNLKNVGYQSSFASMFYNLFDKKEFRWCC